MFSVAFVFAFVFIVFEFVFLWLGSLVWFAIDCLPNIFFFGFDSFSLLNNGEAFFDVLNYGYVKVHGKIVSSPV